MATSWNVLKEFVDVENLIDQLGIGPFTRAGDELTMSCPLPSHGGVDNNPSFSINESKKVYNCFKCGGGDLAQLVMEINGITRNEAEHTLSASSGFPSDPEAFCQIVERTLYFTPDVKSEADIPVYNYKIVRPWHQNALEGEGLAYYESRRIDRSVIGRLHLGYDPRHHRQYSEKFTGIVKDYTGPAAIIPVWHEHHLVGWQERWLEGKPQGVPKYTNTPGLPREEAIYNIGSFDQRYTNDPVALVEAPLTVAYLESHGIPAVATFGTQTNPEQIRQLRRLKKVVLWYDNDVAGLEATAKTGNALDSHVEVLIAPFAPNLKEGPDDIPEGELMDYWHAAEPWWITRLGEVEKNGVL